MKKRLLMTTVLCVAVMAAGCKANNTKSTEAATTAESTVETAAETAESGSEAAETEVAETEAARPEYKALDHVTLGEYKGLEVTLASTKVTDAEINSEIQSTMSANDKLEQLDKGTVEDGDVANIDYEGVLDGEAFEGGTEKGADMTIGAGGFVPGFEDGIKGKEIGSSFDVDLTFPEGYGGEELSGKDVTFHITVNSVKRMPELTDELVAEVSEAKTVEEYKESVKKSLKEQKENTQESQKLNDLFAQVFESSTVNSYPEDVVEYSKNRYRASYEAYAKQAEMTFSEYIQQQMQMSEEDFETALDAQVKQELDQQMILLAIAETEEITVSEKEFEEEAAKYAEMQQMASAEELIAAYGRESVELNIRIEKVLKVLSDNAVTHAADGEAETESEAETATESKETESESETATESKETESETETK